MKVLIAQSIEQLLREGGRTVSDNDRKRADDIGGAFANFYYDATTSNRDVVLKKLQGLHDRIDSDIVASVAKMEMIERTWRGSFNFADESYTQILGETREKLSLRGASAYEPAGLGPVYKWADIWNPESGTFAPDWYQ